MLFSTEMISKYHPDKYADQISDAVLTACLKQDKNSHVACETMVKDNTVVLGGEITSNAMPAYETIVKNVAASLGYKADKIINLITKQSSQICNAVNSDSNIGAGDQGIMFGYACSGGKYYLPFGFEKAIDIIKAVETDIETNPNSILSGDAKTQVTTQLDGTSYRKKIDTVLLSVCHKENIGIEEVQMYLKNLLEKCEIEKDAKLLLNPSGTWTIGGPTADCGLTGRKIVCDQYGGYCPVGGGAFSGKDPTKVDRSASYMARKIAVDLVKKYELKECTVQLAYAIGCSRPVSVNATGIQKNGNAKEFGKEVEKTYDLTPRGIIEHLGLLNLDYTKIATGCHMLAFI